jgi:hypothetical protein
METGTAMFEKHDGHTSDVMNAAELTKRRDGSEAREKRGT